MNYEELSKVNAELGSIDVKGKPYVEVNHRVDGFRKLFPNGAITTEVVALNDGVCVIKAEILDENGKILATGTAYEKEGSTFINKTSYIENCETSAVGRALGFLGIGITTSIASAEEVQNAIENQELSEPVTDTQAKTLVKMVDDTGTDRTKFLKHYKVESFTDMTRAQYGDALNKLSDKMNKRAK